MSNTRPQSAPDMVGRPLAALRRCADELGLRIQVTVTRPDRRRDAPGPERVVCQRDDGSGAVEVIVTPASRPSPSVSAHIESMTTNSP